MRQVMAQVGDLREFDDVMLGSGAVPLAALEQNVDRYIDQRRRNQQ